MRLAAAVLAVLILSGAPAYGADRPATPSTLASVISAAQPGDTILLATGDYGTWTGGAKAAPGVTIKPAAGATPSLGVNFGSSASNLRLEGFSQFQGGTLTNSSNITIADSIFRRPMGVSGGTGIVFDGDTFDGLGTGINEGRLGFVRGAKVTVRNSHFGGGGCSDGIMVSGGGGAAPTVTIDRNVFDGLRQGSCAAHVDPIQFYGATGTVVTSNYFVNNSTGIMSPDCNGSPLTATNNVFVSTGYHAAIIHGGGRDSTIAHNVMVGWALNVDSGNNGCATPRNNVVRDNVGYVNVGGTGNTVIGNVLRSQVSFRGGPGRCGYATAFPVGTASDGASVGLTDCVQVPPPPDPTPTPTPTPAVTATVTPSPEPTATPEPEYRPACAPGCDQAIAEQQNTITDLRAQIGALKAKIAAAVAALTE